MKAQHAHGMEPPSTKKPLGGGSKQCVFTVEEGRPQKSALRPLSQPCGRNARAEATASADGMVLNMVAHIISYNVDVDDVSMSTFGD